ncbi:MAG: hypothetical protein R3351_07930 [Nitrospirales bacterium]|nr:hypothetical protein [Nitrospirales bacterium]
MFVTTRRWVILSCLLLFLFFLDLNNFAAFVVSAVGADDVWKAHGAAVGAEREVARFQRIMRAAVVAASL